MQLEPATDLVWADIVKGKDPHLAVLDTFFARELTETVVYSQPPEDEKKMRKRHKKKQKLDIEDVYVINGQEVYVKRHWGALKNFRALLEGKIMNDVTLHRRAHNLPTFHSLQMSLKTFKDLKRKASKQQELNTNSTIGRTS